MSIVVVSIEVDLEDLPDYVEDIIARSIALKVAKGDFLDSNFNLPISKINNYKIESGFIRRVS